MLISFFPILKILLNQIINFGMLDFNCLIFCDNVFCLRLLIYFLSKKLCLKLQLEQQSAESCSSSSKFARILCTPNWVTKLTN